MLFGATRAEAESIEVVIRFKVIEVAGDVAFVDVGEHEGLAPGMHVSFAPAPPAEPTKPEPELDDDLTPVAVPADPSIVVLEVNAKTAAIRLNGSRVAVGAAGTAMRDITRRAPRLADNTGQWPEVVRPASKQSPTAIALASDTERVRLAVIGHTFGSISDHEPRGEAELRVIGSFELMSERPLGADLDASARAYTTGAITGRPPILVRAASLRWGDRRNPALAVGRLQYASTSLGMLDGGRAALQVGSLRIAAFGGLVPDPLTGRPETGASRFGGEIEYDDPTSELRPRLSVVVHGSTWDGVLDERRVNLHASAVHGRTWLDGWVEVQQFADDNPFGASAVELVGAGASTEWRTRDAHAGIDVSYLVPERSLRIAALIPEWLCTRIVGTAPEACIGDDKLIASTASAGFHAGHWTLDGAASIAQTTTNVTRLGGSGYLRGEYRPGIAGFHVTASGGRAGFADWVSLETGIGVAPSRTFDASLSYRPERLAERGTLADPVLLHAIVADARYAVSSKVDVGVFLLGALGADRDVLAALTTIAWRP